MLYVDDIRNLHWLVRYELVYVTHSRNDNANGRVVYSMQLLNSYGLDGSCAVREFSCSGPDHLISNDYCGFIHFLVIRLIVLNFLKCALRS